LLVALLITFTLSASVRAEEGAGRGPAAASAAVGPAATAQAAPSPKAETRSKPPLPALPKPPPFELPPPSGASLSALDAHLGRLVAKDAMVRETAVSEILEVEVDALPAIRRRLQSLSESTNKEAMKELLGKIRDKARGAIREKAREEGSGEKTKTPDYLVMLEAHARPDDRTWVDLVSVVALSRMLRQIGTVAAARELIGIYARFGEFLRVDTQLGLEMLGERAAAALIEAERHQASKVSTWATRQLDALGKGIPGEAVQTTDPQVLADILRAYGRARDPDAARLVISFANSERTQIRDASRQAVVLMGEVANWQLRDTYENVVGRKPPREWSWERTARELFGEFDGMRLSEVQTLFERGLSAEKAGKLDDAVAAYDSVLAQDPFFERGPEMVPGYMTYARNHLESDRGKAELALRRATRLSPPGSAEANIAESLLLTLEAEALVARHIPDVALLKKADQLDPGNARARKLLTRIESTDQDREARVLRLRYAVAGALAAIAIAGALVIVLRKKSDPIPSSPAPEPEPTPEPHAPAPEPVPAAEPAPEPEPASEAQPDEPTSDRPSEEGDPKVH
jgi:tetratricopeptide (TPR) repeat protein